MTVVREFYANAHQSEELVVMVRRKPIKFDEQSINRHLRIPVPPADEVTVYASNPDLDVVTQEICGTVVPWRMVKGVEATFPSNRLIDTMKVWHHFLCTRMTPMTHLSEVTKERAFLLYGIHMGLAINVGRRISMAIRNAANNLAVGLPFLSLFT